MTNERSIMEIFDKECTIEEIDSLDKHVNKEEGVMIYFTVTDWNGNRQHVNIELSELDYQDLLEGIQYIEFQREKHKQLKQLKHDA